MNVTEIIRRLGGATLAAQKLGEKRSTVSMWVQTKRLPLQHVPKVARALDVPASEIWPELAACRSPSPPMATPPTTRTVPAGQLPMFPDMNHAERAA